MSKNSNRGTDENEQNKNVVEVSVTTQYGKVCKIQIPLDVTTSEIIPEIINRLGLSTSGAYSLNLYFDGGVYRISDNDCPGKIMQKQKESPGYLFLLLLHDDE